MYINSMKQLHNAVLHSLIECSKLTAYRDSLCVFVYKESDHVKWLCVLCPLTYIFSVNGKEIFTSPRITRRPRYMTISFVVKHNLAMV